MPLRGNTSLDLPVSPGQVLFPALTINEPMSRGLREPCLYDNENRGGQSEGGGGGCYGFLNEKAETVHGGHVGLIVKREMLYSRKKNYSDLVFK